MRFMHPDMAADMGGRTHEALWQALLDLEYDWACAIGQAVYLPAARLVFHPDLPRVWDANRVFLSGNRDDAAGWCDDVLHQSRDAGATPIVWDIDRLTPTTRALMRDELLRRGFHEQCNPVQHLVRGQPVDENALAELTVTPARREPDAYAQLCTQWIADDKHEPEMVRSMVAHLDDPKFEPLLALHAGRPVAMAGLQRHGEAGRVEDVYVTPGYRGRGIGTAMIGRVLQMAESRSLRDVFVVSAPLNMRARRLYQRLGFGMLRNYTVFITPEVFPNATAS